MNNTHWLNQGQLSCWIIVYKDFAIEKNCDDDMRALLHFLDLDLDCSFGSARSGVFCTRDILKKFKFELHFRWVSSASEREKCNLDEKWIRSPKTAGRRNHELWFTLDSTRLLPLLLVEDVWSHWKNEKNYNIKKTWKIEKFHNLLKSITFTLYADEKGPSARVVCGSGWLEFKSLMRLAIQFRNDLWSVFVLLHSCLNSSSKRSAFERKIKPARLVMKFDKFSRSIPLF